MNIVYVRQLASWGAITLPQNGKRPNVDYAGLRDADLSLDDILGLRTSKAKAPAWQYADSIGIIAGRGDWTAIDIDFDNPAVLAAILKLLGLPDDYPWVEKTRRGYHLYILCAAIPLNGTGKLNREARDGGGHIELIYGTKANVTLQAHRFPGGQLPSEQPTRVEYSTLIAAYDAVTIAPPEPEQFVSKQFVPLHADGTDDLWDAYCAEIDRAAVDYWHIDKFDADGYSDNHSCVFHEGDREPSAGYSNQWHGVKCFACGNHGPHEVAAKLGLLTWEQYRADHRQAVVSLHYHKSQDDPTAPSLRIFANGLFHDGFPRRLAHVIMGIHKLDLPYRLESQMSFLKVYHAADMLMTRELLAIDTPVSAADMQRLAEKINIRLSRHDAEQGLEQGSAWGVCPEFCENLSRSICSPIISGQKIAKPGRPSKLYRFNRQHLAAVRDRLAHLYREHAFHTHTPSDVFADWFDDFSEDRAARWNEARQPIYREYATERERAQAILDELLGEIDRHFDAIRRGTHKPLDLPDCELGKTRTYHEAMTLALIKQSGGTLEKAYPKLEKKLCVSQGTVTSILKNIGAITLPRHATIAAADEKPSHQVISRNPTGGTVTIKSYGAAILRNDAPPELIEQDEQNRQRQRTRSLLAARKRHKPARQHSEHETLTHFDAAKESSPPVISQTDTVPAVHSREFITMQLQPAFMPGEIEREAAEILAPHAPAAMVNQMLDELREVRSHDATAPAPIAEQPQVQQSNNLKDAQAPEPPAPVSTTVDTPEAEQTPAQEYGEIRQNAAIEPPASAWTNDWKAAFWQRTAARGIAVSRLWAHTGVSKADDFFAAYTPIQAGQLLDQLARAA